MKAFEVLDFEGGTDLRECDIAEPKPAEGEVLVRVCAAGVTPMELSWSTTKRAKDGSPRKGAVPGHEFSGIIVSVGSGVTRFKAGDEVFGVNDWFIEGATAEFCVASVDGLVFKPKTLSHQEAATVPISALTAWQGLITRAKVKSGERVLVIGAAGAVGLMVVQVAKLQGCEVVASASAEDFALLRDLGVSECIDYQRTQFETVVKDIDVVFDTVGGDSLLRAEPLLRKGGRLIAVATEAKGTRDPLAAGAFFIVERSAEELAIIAELIDSGLVRTFVKRTYLFDEASEAYLGKDRAGRRAGKAVINVSDSVAV